VSVIITGAPWLWRVIRRFLLTDGGRMDTVYLRVNSENPDEAILKKAAELIRKGELVVFPTETVYGLGANTLMRRPS
jgi:hypothetical protein